MKKGIATLLAVCIMVFLLTACSGPEQTTPVSTPDDSTTNGQSVPDAVTSASVKESSDPDKLIAGLSESGYWIFAILSDVNLQEELVVSGEFYNKDDINDRVYRKLSLYAQDEQHHVTAEYTLTVPIITVLSPNFRIQNGTVKGDISVDALGFELFNSTLEGNLTFKTQEQMDSADLGSAKITGDISIES
jgi:hypothetical protein